MRSWWLALLGAAFLAWPCACTSSGAALVVEVRTGLVPGPEFTTVETEVLRPGPADGERVLVRSAVALARFGQPFATGRRVAELEGIPAGTYTVRVTLVRPDGRSVLVARSVLVSLTEGQRRVVRVILDRGCVEVECPAPGGSPALSECLGGRCVDPRCEPPDPTYCGDFFCNADDDCPAGPPCSTSRCLDGVCELLARDEGPDACPDGTWCSVGAGGCAPLTGGPMDAGPDGAVLCGTVCTGAGGPCEVGYWDCATGTPECRGFLLQPVGTRCGGGVCDDRGACVACPAGARCREDCRDGTVDCSSGSARCVPLADSVPGAACDPGSVRLAGLEDGASAFACDAGGECVRRQSISFDPARVDVREGGVARVTVRTTATVRGSVEVTLRLAASPLRALVDLAGTPVDSLVVTIADGRNGATFDVRAFDDGLLSGPSPFTIVADTVSATDLRFDGFELPDLPGSVHDACVAPTADCDGLVATGCETSLESSTDCGRCGNVCPAGPHGAATCGGGVCGIACDDGWANCNTLPFDGCEGDLTAAWSCGACGRGCPDDAPICEVEVGGTRCSPDCTPPETLCGLTTCVDTARDPDHCGACGAPCPERANSSPTCAGGTCGLRCDPGYADCDGAPGNGCETRLTSLAACGGCGLLCSLPAARGSCATGTCVLAMCEPGFDNCDGDDTNGCELTLGTLENCGACGDTCAAGGPGSTGTSCVAGRCTLACMPGLADCNGVASDGCEADLTSDATCGRCDRACAGVVPAGVDSCAGGSCVLACDPMTADCNLSRADGCETALGTPTSCSSCGESCDFPRASAACTATGCTITACEAGWRNCDGDVTNGCELALGGACTPLGSPCNAGTVACNDPRLRPVCTAGARLPEGTPCGTAGGTCSASGTCPCPPGTPVNTPCAVDSVCNAAEECVRNRFWEHPGCAAVTTGDDLCVGRGFARAVSAYGYSWSECGGPNGSIGAADNCLEYDADRARCLDWTPGYACNSASLAASPYGVTLTEYGGAPDYVFRVSDFWGRGCPGWNPGYSIRTTCEF